MRKKHALIFISLGIFVSTSRADTEGDINEMLSKTIPPLFGIPEDELNITDFRNSDEYERGKELEYLLGLKFRPKEERKYAFLSISVAKSGSDILNEISKIIKESASLPTDHRSHGVMKKKEFSNGMTTYSGLLGFGPGGSDTVALVEWPSKNIDILLELSVPGDPPLKWKVVNNAEHLEIIGKGINEDLLNKMVVVFKKTFAEYAPEKNESQGSRRLKNRLGSEVEELHQLPKTAADESYEEVEDNTSNTPSRHPWIVAGVLLIGILLLLLKTFRSKASS